MKFPGSDSSRAWVRMDGRTGLWTMSSADGPTMVDLKGRKLGVDIARAVQGWLATTPSFDWQELATPDVWGTAPSPDHRAGVKIDLIALDGVFGDAPVREARGNSRAFTTFVAKVFSQVGSADPDGPVPVIKINAVRTIKVGAGTSVEIDFAVGPRESWIARDRLDADGGAPAPAPAPAAKPAPKAARPVFDDDDQF